MLDHEQSCLYSEQVKYDGAEPLYKRAREIGKKTFGPDHPDVAVALENMAELYKEIGKNEEAEIAKKIHFK